MRECILYCIILTCFFIIHLCCFSSRLQTSMYSSSSSSICFQVKLSQFGKIPTDAFTNKYKPCLNFFLQECYFNSLNFTQTLLDLVIFKILLAAQLQIINELAAYKRDLLIVSFIRNLHIQITEEMHKKNNSCPNNTIL